MNVTLQQQANRIDLTLTPTLMRRHIWLFSDLHAVYSDTAMEMHQALESVNRVVLLFDYIIYILAQLHHELDKR